MIPGEGAQWLFLYLSPILLITIVAGGIYLGMTGRGHVLITVPLAIALLCVGQYVKMSVDVQRVSHLDQRDFREPEYESSYVVIDSDGSRCGQICTETLTRSPYQPVAERSREKTWKVFRLITGSDCLSGENRKSYFAFLSAGFAGRCAASDTQPVGADALVFRDYYQRSSGNSPHNIPAEFPDSFEGKVYRLFERRNGEERLLAQWVDGNIRPVSYWFGLVGLRGMKVGERFERHEFYAAALKAPFVGGPFSGDSDLEQVFRELEVFLVDPEFSKMALSTLGTLSQWKGDDQQQMIARHVASLLNSTQPDKLLAGFRIAGQSQDFDPTYLKSRIVQLLDHENAEVVAAALSAAFKLSKEDRIGLTDKFSEMATSPALLELDSPVLSPLLGHMRYVERFPEETRQRAKRLFEEDGRLSAPQRTALLAIVAHGEPTFRAEAGKLILSTDILALRDIVIIVNEVGWKEISAIRRDDWTDSEMKELVDRAALLPVDQVQKYINALRRHDAFETYRDDAAEIVGEHLRQAKSAPNPDPKLIKALERFTESLE